MKSIILFLILTGFFSHFELRASDDDKHPHDESEYVDHEKEKEHEDHDDHGNEEKHGEHEGHGNNKAIGPGKAIESFDEHKGLKLNPKALTLLEIKTVPMKDITNFPESSLLSIKSEKSIFILRDSYFSRLVLRSGDTLNSLKAKHRLMEEDALVISGIDILRASEVYATDKAEYGHGH